MAGSPGGDLSQWGCPPPLGTSVDLGCGHPAGTGYKSYIHRSLCVEPRHRGRETPLDTQGPHLPWSLAQGTVTSCGHRQWWRVWLLLTVRTWGASLEFWPMGLSWGPCRDRPVGEGCAGKGNLHPLPMTSGQFLGEACVPWVSSGLESCSLSGLGLVESWSDGVVLEDGVDAHQMLESPSPIHACLLAVPVGDSSKVLALDGAPPGPPGAGRAPTALSAEAWS